MNNYIYNHETGQYDEYPIKPITLEEIKAGGVVDLRNMEKIDFSWPVPYKIEDNLDEKES